MDYFSMKDVFVPCTYYSNMKDENHITKMSKLLVINCLHFDYTFLIPVSAKVNTQDVIEIFKRYMFPTTSYLNLLVTDQDILFM